MASGRAGVPPAAEGVFARREEQPFGANIIEAGKMPGRAGGTPALPGARRRFAPMDLSRS